MNDTFEGRLRDALHKELDVIDVHSLRPTTPDVLVSHQSRWKNAPALAVAAAFAVVAAAAGAAFLFGAHSTPPTNSASPQQQAANALTVQGARIFVPDGLYAADASAVEPDITDPYRYCLLPQGVELTADGCLDDGGVLVKLAKVVPNEAVAGVQGAFQSDCGGLEGSPTVPLLTDGMIGAASAQVVTITCGSDTASSSTFWQTVDRTLIIQSPFNGSQGFDVATQVAQKSDLSHWLHTS